MLQLHLSSSYINYIKGLIFRIKGWMAIFWFMFRKEESPADLLALLIISALLTTFAG